MRFSISRRFSIGCLLSCWVALHGLGGCDPAEEWSGEGVEERSGEASMFGPGLDPIPGGGTCEECVTDSALTNIGQNTWRLDLCIDGGIKYIGTSTSSGDDIPLKGLLDQLPAPEDVDWRLVGADAATLCASDTPGGCTFKKPLINGDKVHLSVEIPSNLRPKPSLLRFHPADAPLDGGSRSPAMKIRADSSPGFKCEMLASQDPLMSKVVEMVPIEMVPPSALAHITAGFAYGGVQSCSGVLIAPQYVLTAAHCLSAQDSKAANIFQLESTRVQFLGIWNTPAPNAFGVDSIHLHPDRTRDLALLRLQAVMNVSETPPIPIAMLLPESFGCTLAGRGFGRSTRVANSDWGRGKAIPVQAVSGDGSLLDAFDPGELAKLLVLKDSGYHQDHLCRGDSGGPIVQTCNGQSTVVGIASARAFKADSLGKFSPMGMERLARAFAFSYGNSCGEGDLIAYVAGRIDDEVQMWSHSVVGPLPVSF